MRLITRRAMLARLAAGGGTVLVGGTACGTSSITRASGACPAVAGRRIRWIVPNAAGGGYDTESRRLQPFLERRLGAGIVIHNMAGAGGLLGARAIAAAAGDGLTVGIVGMPGLLVAGLLGQPAPNPVEAFTILGRVSRSLHVWASGARSGLTTLARVIDAGRRRPLVFGINEIGSANVVSIAVTAALLDVRIEFVPGFSGTREASLAAARGDVDLVCFNFDTIRPLVAAGEMTAVVQISERAIAADPLLAAAPMLGGPGGFAASHAREAGGDEARAIDLAGALVRVVGSGRVVVAPRGLEPSLASCYSGVLQGAIADANSGGLAAGPDETADGASAVRDVAAAAGDAARLLPFVQPVLAKIRG